MKKLLLFLFVALALLLSACAGDALPAPESDSDQSYQSGSEIPVDDNVYTLRGEIVSDIRNHSTVNAEGYVSGTVYGGYGGMSGSYAVWQEGKGFVRILVEDVSPYTELAEPGSVIIIKTTDQKIMALLPGDKVTFKCRAQYEAIAAVREYETFNAEKVETWEIDYCRMVTPEISPAEVSPE